MKLTAAVGWLARRGMLASILLITGVTMAVAGLTVFLAAGVSLLYGELTEARDIAAAALTTAVGAVLRWSVERPTTLTTGAGFAGVGIAWLMMSVCGTLPYLFSARYRT